MFTLSELEASTLLPALIQCTRTLIPSTHLQEDPAAILDIKEDIREECTKLGDVTNVVLYDKEPDGIASVRYSNPEAARACVNVRLLESHHT